jgi:hypothetical protein
MHVNEKATPRDLLPKLGRFWELSAQKIVSGEGESPCCGSEKRDNLADWP